MYWNSDLGTNQLKSKIENQVVYVNDLETSNKCKEKAVQNLQVSNEALTTEKEKLKSKNGNQCDYIKVLETSNKTAKEASKCH